MMEQETVRAEQRIEGKLEQAHNSSADAKQTKRRQEEMKEGTCKLMSAQTQTPLPLQLLLPTRGGLILRCMAQNKYSPAEVSGQTPVSRPTRQVTLSTDTPA